MIDESTTRNEHRELIKTLIVMAPGDPSPRAGDMVGDEGFSTARTIDVMESS